MSLIISIKKLITNYFSKGHERSINVKRNILYSFIIKGVSIVVTFLLIPITIHYVSPEKYGIWLTLSSIISWVGFFDIGIGNGLRNKLAETKAIGDFKLARIYVSTTYAILSIIIILIWLVFIVVNPYIDWTRVLNTSAELRNELKNLVFIVFSFFCLRFVFQLITTILLADQKTARASFYNLIGNILSLLLIYILTRTTQGSLYFLALVLGGMPVLVLIVATILYFKFKYKDFSPQLKYVNFGYAKNLMTLGIKFFIIQIAALIIYQTNNIIIAQLYGPKDVTVYNIAYSYFYSVLMVFGIIITPFWSAFTEANAKNDIQWIRNTMKKLIQIWLGLTLVVLLMLMFSKLFYELWVGKNIQIPFTLSIVVAIYIIVNAWCSIFANYINGVGKIKLQLYSGLFGTFVNIPLSFYLGKQMGISGVITSGIILGLFSSIWSPIQYYLIINKKAKGIWNK